MKKHLAGVVAVVAVAVGLSIPAGAGAAQFTCPDGSDPVNVNGTKTCSYKQGAPNSSSDKTLEQKGSFNSSHPTCKTPPPQGKCS